MDCSLAECISSTINMKRNLGCTKYSYILVVVMLLLCSFVTSNPPNPCPQLFQYQYDGSEWYGVIQINNIAVGQTVTIRVKLSLAALLSSNYVGALELFEDRRKTLQGLLVGRPVTYKVRFPLQNPLPRITEINVNNQVLCSGPPENGLQISKIHLENTLYTSYINRLGTQPANPFITDQIEVSFPNNANGFTGQIPGEQQSLNNNYFQLPQFTNNGFGNNIPSMEVITSNPGTFSPNLGTANNALLPSLNSNQATFSPNLGTANNALLPSLNSNQATFSPNLFQPSLFIPPSNAPQNTFGNEVCGQIDPKFNSKQLVVGGENLPRGSWPWLAAIFLSDKGSLGFKCGGSLVSATITVTAAHCFILEGKRYKPENVLVGLGTYNIRNWNEPGSITIGSSGIFTHPDYEDRRSTFDADIAVVRLKEAVSFTDTIRPICLWSGPPSVKDIEGIDGTVVGWGKDEFGNEVSPEPKKVQATIFSDTTCVRSNKLFRPITSKRNFCAGLRDGRGPCTGDSGSGLMVYREDRWEIRGTVAGSLADTKTSNCDLREFIVYVDISNFIDWIQSYM